MFARASTSNTRDTISWGRRLREIGVDGLLVGRPAWLRLDDRQIVDFYTAVADALPEASLVLYDNMGVFKGPISADEYAQLSSIDQIVASKHCGVRDGDGGSKRFSIASRSD